MKSTLSIETNTDKRFILLLEDSQEVSFEEKDLFSFVKYKSEELKIFNKDKSFIFSKFNYELKNTLEKYILNKKDRLAKLNRILIEEGLSEKIKIVDRKVTILNLNSGDDINCLFSSLLRNKNKHSTLFKMLFSDENVLINNFISKDKKEIFHNIDKIANKINNNGALLLFKNKKQLEVYDRKMSIMLEVQSIKSEAMQAKNDCINKLITENYHTNIKHKINKEHGNDLSEIHEGKLRIINKINKKKEEINKLLDALNKGALNVIRAIGHIYHFIDPNDKSITNEFINEVSANIDKLKNRYNSINLNIDFFKLNIEDLNKRLDEINLIVIGFDENGKRIAMFKDHKLNAIYEGVASYKTFTINKDDVGFKKCFFDKLRDISSQLCLYNESLENPKNLFFRIYKYFFPNKYLEKQKKSNNAFNKLDMLYKNLFCLLQSKDFINNSVPKWACKLVAKTINESIPMNDVFWRLSKERTEWNKIYKEFILEEERA